MSRLKQQSEWERPITVRQKRMIRRLKNTCITIEEASKSEARSEGYYLTVQVPETTGYSIINNRLNYGAFSRKEGTLPAKITSDAAQSGSSYLVYKGVEQTFKISTSRVHNGSSMDDTIMENRDSVKIKTKVH